MDTDRGTNWERPLPEDGEIIAADREEAAADDGEEDWDDEEEGWNDQPEEPSPAPVRPPSRRDARSVVLSALILAGVLLFGWVIVRAIVDAASERREREIQHRQDLYSYHDPTASRSSSGGSSSYGSSGSTYKPKSTGGDSREDEYNAADFGNAEDFYDEHYDDFFDYYDAEDYWNEYN